MICYTDLARDSIANHTCAGPVTDYGSTMVHYMQNRQPRYRATMYNQGEVERASASYIIDVSG